MPQTDKVLQTVAGFIESQGLGGGQRAPAQWVVALSGGLDSMVLLYALIQVAERFNATLEAVHVEHGLRANSEDDLRFVERTCAQWGVPLHTRSIQIARIPKTDRRGTEADARALRYEAIGSMIAQAGKDPTVFLGHHADDQLETVLLRLIRGSSLTGMGGIRSVREWKGIRFARPFLSLQKEQLKAFADAFGVSHIEDETNHQLNYARNFLRHAVVPRLRELQPNLTEVVDRTTTVWQAEDDWLESCSRVLVRECAVEVPFGWRLDTRRLQSAALPLQRRAVKIILYCLASADWTFNHVESILKLCAHSDPSAEIHLPLGIRAERVYDTVQVVRRPQLEPTSYERVWDPLMETVIHIPLEHAGVSWELAAVRGERVGGTPTIRLTTQFEALFPHPIHFTVRPTRRGERMQLFGSAGSKKVQDIFVDAKVPRSLRLSWPCVYVGSELVWLPGLARSRLYCLTGDEVKWNHVTARKSNISPEHQRKIDQGDLQGGYYASRS